MRIRHVAVLAVLGTLASVGLPHRALAQQVTLVGRVLDAKTDRQIAGARVEIRSLNLGAQSDSTGAFRIRGVPPGVHQVVVRAIGYDSVAARVQVAVNDSIISDFRLSASATALGTVRVEAPIPERYRWRLSEFNERRAAGLGRFLDWQFFEKNEGRRVPAILIGRFAGIRTMKGGGSAEYLASTRYGQVCLPQVLVNGIINPDFDLNSITAGEIIGFEYYTTSTTPAKYNITGTGISGAQCGTALFWTK